METTNTSAEVASQLITTSDKINVEDKIKAAERFRVHTETINRYMRGDVRKEAFGLEILAFMKKRIANREKALA